MSISHVTLRRVLRLNKKYFQRLLERCQEETKLPSSLGQRYKTGLTLVLASCFTAVMVLAGGVALDEPGPSPADKAWENLTRFDIPSQRSIPWRPRFIMPQDTLESLYGDDWVWVARFNRVDRRHAYPGVTIKEPLRIADVKGYQPLPGVYPQARTYGRYLLLDKGEQWIAGYDRGLLAFSAPAATGKAGTETPNGIYRIDARHRKHTSSLYKIEEEGEQYPMDNALRFHIDEQLVGYWIHARDLPGRPASHGCIGLFDEVMQKRMFSVPQKPVLMDSQKLYAWAVPDSIYGEDSGDAQEIQGGPVLEVRGELPNYR